MSIPFFCCVLFNRIEWAWKSTVQIHSGDLLTDFFPAIFCNASTLENIFAIFASFKACHDHSTFIFFIFLFLLMPHKWNDGILTFSTCNCKNELKTPSWCRLPLKIISCKRPNSSTPSFYIFIISENVPLFFFQVNIFRLSGKEKKTVVVFVFHIFMNWSHVLSHELIIHGIKFYAEEKIKTEYIH